MAKNWLCLASALLMAFLLAACGGGGGTRDSIATSTVLAPPDTTSASGAYQGASDYRIGAQDLLQISVFGVKELDKDVRVNSNGQISLPLSGGVMAGGKTIPELETELEAIRHQDYAVDAEEFVDGLVCVAVPVRQPGQRGVRCAVALQAPVARMALPHALRQLPRLRAAAAALARTWA